jgi:predicted Zn-dependent protease
MLAMRTALLMLCMRALGAGQVLDQALALEQAGKGDQAIFALESLIREQPRSELARVEAARLRLKLGLDLPIAEYHLEVASALAPENPRIHYLLGQLLEERGQPQEALRAYERAVFYRENYDDARLRLAGLYYTKADWVSAEKQYRFLAQAHPEWVQVRTQLASAIEKQGRREDCERELRAVVQRYPSSPVGVRALASFYERTDRPELAAPLLEKLNRSAKKKKMRDLRRSTR